MSRPTVCEESGTQRVICTQVENVRPLFGGKGLSPPPPTPLVLPTVGGPGCDEDPCAWGSNSTMNNDVQYNMVGEKPIQDIGT